MVVLKVFCYNLEHETLRLLRPEKIFNDGYSRNVRTENDTVMAAGGG